MTDMYYSENLKYVSFLKNIKNLGSVRVKMILETFGNLEDFKSVSKNKLEKLEGVSGKISDEIIKAVRNLNEFDKWYGEMMRRNEKYEVSAVTITDEKYPANLKKIYDPPSVLYYKGELRKEDEYSLSFVGTRTPTEYGRNACRKLAEEVSGYGIPIVSGMARGIDTLAHRTALEKRNLTYAVLGCGLDVIYPQENKRLFEVISERGAVISEFECGTGPDKMNFPRRNRVISGISQGTVIIETGIKGGSMITAGFALDQNREVFAVPGYIFSRKSEGANELIKKGQAKLVSKFDDIFDELYYVYKDFVKKEGIAIELKVNEELSIFEKKIYDVLGTEPVHIDSICEMTGFSVSDCLVNLLSLEFKGIIKQLPGKNFIKI